jgi:CheY-like chemotaxis protein
MTKLSQVVLIDDDDTNNYLNQVLIFQLAVAEQVTLLSNGNEAIQYLQRLNQCPPFMFLDINMPSMDGFEFLEAFYKLHLPGEKETVIVVLTTSKNPLDINRINRLGTFEYVNKPLTEEKLISLLQKYFPQVAETITGNQIP